MRPTLEPGTAVLHDPTVPQWLLFSRPVGVLTARAPVEVLPLLAEIEGQTHRHALFAAGFVAFEAAPAFDSALVTTRDPGAFPLAWFGLYQAPKAFHSAPQAPRPLEPIDWRFSLRQEQYFAAIRRIKTCIRAGETYQVNFSLRLQAAFAGDPWSLFARLVQAQGPHYAAFINADPWWVCSASPELFFRLDGAQLVSRPMKGTAARGLWPAQDKEHALQLAASEKNRSENVMIVDMVRNDLGRVARPGSVRVDGLFAVERYPTVWQMTSAIACATVAPVSEIFRALFPAASITGAPKVRTMQLIAELESSPRRIYTGAIGFFAPGRQAQFNVAIRSVLINRAAGTAEYGVGGGIVWDSTPGEEFEECRVKTGILNRTEPEFDLLETILWEPGTGFFLLENHLARLAESADYFSRPLSLDRVRDKLRQLEDRLSPIAHRVRLTVSREGQISLTARTLTEPGRPYRVAISKKPIRSNEPLLYHKTTRRQLYEQAVADSPGFDDVLLWNENEELTESTIGNLAVKHDGQLLTPPVRCGLLPGVYRSWLLSQGILRERVIRLRDLERSATVYLMNSVRRMWKVSLAQGRARASR